MSQEIQQLQNEVIRLKSRAYDLTEMVGQHQEELKHYQNLTGHLCKILGIDGSQGVSPEALIGAVQALVESPVQEPAPEQEPELLTEAEPKA